MCALSVFFCFFFVSTIILFVCHVIGAPLSTFKEIIHVVFIQRGVLFIEHITIKKVNFYVT